MWSNFVGLGLVGRTVFSEPTWLATTVLFISCNSDMSVNNINVFRYGNNIAILLNAMWNLDKPASFCSYITSLLLSSVTSSVIISSKGLSVVALKTSSFVINLHINYIDDYQSPTIISNIMRFIVSFVLFLATSLGLQ